MQTDSQLPGAPPGSAPPGGSVNRGYLYERTLHNPLEAALASAWEKENEKRRHINFGFGILQDLFMERGKFMFESRCVHEVTDAERMVAATVIQWLGSNCGRSFYEEALRKCGYKVVAAYSPNDGLQRPAE